VVTAVVRAPGGDGPAVGIWSNCLWQHTSKHSLWCRDDYKHTTVPFRW